MGLLDDLETFFSTQSLAGIVGTTSVTDTGWTIAKAFMPPDPDQCLCVYETGGPAPEVRAFIHFPTFQVRARAGSTGYATARSKLMDVFTNLRDIGPTVLNNSSYAGFVAISDAISLGTDAQDQRPLLVQNFQALRATT